MTKAYISGAIYTVDEPVWASALIVDGPTIIAVGDEESLRGLIEAADEVVDLEGRMVMPGIHDAHTHLVSGLQQFEVELPAGADEDQIVAALRAWDGPRPLDARGNAWLIGGRYWPDSLRHGPRRDFLDEAFPDVPVMLHDRSAHNELLNSMALELAGIDDRTPEVPHGRVIRDADGRLTGELWEHSRWPVFRHMGVHSDEVVERGIRYAVELNHRYGVTSLQDASSTAQLLKVLRRFDAEDTLGLHVAGHLVWREESFGMATLDQLEQMIVHHADHASAHVDTRFVKLWLDGSPIPPYWTHACVHEDNTVDEENLLVPQAELNDAIARFDRMGLTVKVHCGGEGAVRRSLDAIEHARNTNGPQGPVHEVAHCASITPQDLPRFAELNVIAEMSPAVWHIPEHNVMHLFDFETVLDAGILMTFGTDWSVSDSPNLFPALQGAVQRTEQGLSLADGLAALTINGARAVGCADVRGSLTPGKSADFIVLDRNLFEVAVSELGETRVLETVFEGRSVYADTTRTAE